MIGSTNSEFEAHINTIENQFLKRGYEKILIENQIEKAAKLDRSVFLRNKIKVKKHHAFHYQSLITGHFQT